MKIALTPQLLRYLVIRGYRYCLSETGFRDKPHLGNYMILTPLHERPSLRVVNSGYDALFSLKGEPARLAIEAEQALVMVSLDMIALLDYLKFLLNKYE